MTREEREKAITYFEQCNSNIISVCKDENNYDYEKQDIISYSARKTYEANKLAIEALEFVTSYEGIINKLTEVFNQQKEGHWKIIPFSNNGEYRPNKYECSECGWKIDLCRGLQQDTGHRLFCEHCGAKMKGGE